MAFKKVKRLIYQVYLGKPSKLYDWCTSSVKAYADNIGADYIVQTEPILKIRPNAFRTGRSKEAVERLGYLPIYEKENAFDHLDRYDEICIIDSDVYIREAAPSIFDHCTKYPDEAFFGVFEKDMPITPQYQQKIFNYSHMQYREIFPPMNVQPQSLGYPFMNMGVMLFTSALKKYIMAPSAKSFLLRRDFVDFVDGMGAWKWSTDQTLLNYWLHKDRVPHRGISWKWNGLFTANTKIDQCHFVHFFLKDKLPDRGENVKELMSYIGVEE